MPCFVSCRSYGQVVLKITSDALHQNFGLWNGELWVQMCLGQCILRGLNFVLITSRRAEQKLVYMHRAIERRFNAFFSSPDAAGWNSDSEGAWTKVERTSSAIGIV